MQMVAADEIGARLFCFFVHFHQVQFITVIIWSW